MSLPDDMLITIDPTVNVYIPNAMGVSDGNNRFIIGFGPAISEGKYLHIWPLGQPVTMFSMHFRNASFGMGWAHCRALVNPGGSVSDYGTGTEVDGTVLQKKWFDDDSMERALLFTDPCSWILVARSITPDPRWKSGLMNETNESNPMNSG